MHQIKRLVLDLVSRLCETEAKPGCDQIEQILATRRNKNIFWISFPLMICLPFLMRFNGFSFDLCMKLELAYVMNFTLFLSVCRSYIWIYHIWFVALNAIFPIILVNISSEYAYFQVGQIIMGPMLVLLLTNRVFYSSLIAVIHAVLAMFKTKYVLRNNFETMDPDIFVDKIVHSELTYALSALIVWSVTMHRLGKKTREAMVANRMSEETIEKQKTFLFSFSHEMRNPLNSLFGNLELALMENLPGKVEGMIKTAQICAGILLQQINNVLDTGKQDIGSLEINLSQVEVHNLFQRLWALSGELVKKKNLKGIFKIDKKMPKILLLDAHRITQMMMNLIGNAIKFTDRGTLTVSVNWYEDAVVNDEIFEPLPYDDENEGIFEKNECVHLLQTRFKRSKDSSGSLDSDRRDYYTLDHQKKLYRQISSLQDAKGVLKIIISDTGSGMSAESLKQLFQKFSQVSSDPNKRKIGTGLGLFITKEICTKMEAEIRVYSKLGTGTTFIICIPTMSVSVKPKFQRQRTLASMVEVLALQNLNCLVADDSPLNVAMVCNYFEKIGISSANTAGNGEDSLNLYKQNRLAGKMVDIVTLDIEMPKMDGKTACQKIREFEKENKLSPAIIILISGNYEAEQMDFLGKDKKADCFLKKPVTFEEFSSTIFRLLDARTHYESD